MINERECLICGKPTQSPLQWRVYCNDCRERVLLLQVAVSQTMKRYDVPHASEFKCVDCGAQASVYDHRYYSHPLEVDPVCSGCNSKRGPALDVVPCVTELAHYGISSKYGTPAVPIRVYPVLAVKPSPVDCTLPLQEGIDKYERERIETALDENKHNRTAAAKSIGITFRALRYRMERLGIE